MSSLNNLSVFQFVRNDIVKINDRNGVTYDLRTDIGEENTASLFKPFRLPLFDWTKVQMGEHTKKMGTYDIMELTWFCHHPKGEEQCGTCNHCKDAIIQGMAYRMSKGAMRRYRMLPVTDSLKKVDSEKVSHQYTSLTSKYKTVNN